MQKYVYVFVGGATGGLIRSLITRAESPVLFWGLDPTILLINVLGGFLLGFFLSGPARSLGLSTPLRVGIAAGLLGSFTTFSSLSMEASGLFVGGHVIGGLVYIGLSCSLGLGAAQLGIFLGNTSVARDENLMEGD